MITIVKTPTTDDPETDDPEWALRIGDSQADIGQAVALNQAGNVAVAGSFTNPQTRTSDILVAKYSPSGVSLWLRRFESQGSGTAYGVAMDDAGDVMVTGWFRDTVDFGGGPLAGLGNLDVFVAKLSGLDGSHLWSRRFGSPNPDVGSTFVRDCREKTAPIT